VRFRSVDIHIPNCMAPYATVFIHFVEPITPKKATSADVVFLIIDFLQYDIVVVKCTLADCILYALNQCTLS